MKIKWHNIEIKGSPEEIIQHLRENISWTKYVTNKKYLNGIRKRINQLYGVTITTEDYRKFLITLKNFGEIDIIEDESIIKENKICVE